MGWLIGYCIKCDSGIWETDNNAEYSGSICLKCSRGSIRKIITFEEEIKNV